MKKGLELFKCNKSFQIETVMEFEKLLSIKLPTSLRYFYSCFELGEGKLENAKRNFEGVLMDITSVQFYDKVKNIDRRLSHFYSLNEIIDIWNDIKSINQYNPGNILPIAITSIRNEKIFVSLEKESLGTIWCEDSFNANPYAIYKIANDIYEFISQLYETDILDKEFKGKVLYQRWGENFWRVKE